MANFEGIFTYYPVSIAGVEGTKKENNEIVKTGYYELMCLALDNGLKKNANGLYETVGKSAHSTVSFKVPKEYIKYIKYMEPVKCLAELTPLSYDFFIKVKQIEINGKMVNVVVGEE